MPGQLYIGLMTGTSLDAIDAALVRVSDQQVQLLDALEQHFPKELYQQLLSLCQPGDNEIERLGPADRQLAECYAEACGQLLQNNGLSTEDIDAIGCHGQTLRHRPGGRHGFTLQIGDPNTLAQLTGITTVTDFRRRDIAAGGQGAPLAPAFHQAAFSSDKHPRAIINIGGMSNITLLHPKQGVQGFDTGPGNVLMDAWVKHKQGLDYDSDGQWAASGQIQQSLLSQLLTHPFFSLPAPKSTGREDFNLGWLLAQLRNQHYLDEDVQATLLELTAQSICRELNQTDEVNEVYLCGGGVYNRKLLQRLEALLHPRLVATTATLGIAPEWVEAACFAWLAHQTINRRAIETDSITGAGSNNILGGIYYA